MKNIFLSHAGADKDIITELCKILEKSNRKGSENIVYSSLAKTGAQGGDILMPWINKKLERCEVFLVVITENYVRSLYCMYELNLALYLYSKRKIKKFIPICSNMNVYHKVENLLSSYGLVYLIASGNDKKKDLIIEEKAQAKDEETDVTLKENSEVQEDVSASIKDQECNCDAIDEFNKEIREIKNQLDNHEVRLHDLEANELDEKENESTGGNVVERFTQTISKYININYSDYDSLREIMQKISTIRPNSPYIGCTAEEYNYFISYCEQQNIKKIQDQSIPIEELKKNLLNCDEIVIFSTTGIGVLRNLRENVFVDALLKGINIHVIVANPYSDFCQDVALIEDLYNDGDLRKGPLASEFNTGFGYLKEAYDKAKEKKGYKPLGDIKLYCAYTLLRQTIVMGRKNNGEGWCLLSVTMPPKRSNTKTPSLVIEGNTNNKNLLISTVWEHCYSVMQIAIKRKGMFSISDTPKSHPFYLEKETAKEYWNNKRAEAMEFMCKKSQSKQNSNKILIEVAAQHPLKNGTEPNEEFEERLKCAVSLYNNLQNQGKIIKIYVPGSIHKFENKVDSISLSEAGKIYLIKQGIPDDDIFGDEANLKYKGVDGVYNSGDECYVASQLFKDGEYEGLYCICSPMQVMRKTLFYYEFGIIPQCISVSTQVMFHNPIEELLDSLPNVLYKDHNWQDRDGEAFINSRKTRKP